MLLKPTFSTIPVTPPRVITSPTTKGLSKKMVNDPNKFSILSFEARAIATPPTPSPAIKAVMFTPNTFPRIITSAKIIITTFVRSIAKGISPSSTLLSVWAALSFSLIPTKSIDLRIVQKIEQITAR